MSQDRQDKKSQFNAEKKKSGSGTLVVGIVVVAVVAAVAGFMLFSPGGGSSLTNLKSVDGKVRIDLNEVSDGQAHYFTLDSNQGPISFFVVKSVDGVVRAAFDACDVCYKSKKGYRQEGDMMVCNNCNQKFRTDMINEVKGGCNPAPLHRQIEGQQLVISEQDILSGAWYFGG